MAAGRPLALFGRELRAGVGGFAQTSDRLLNN
jgi:hypothetical protein